MSMSDLLNQLNEEMKNYSPSSIEDDSLSTEDALKSLKKEIESNRDPRIKALDKYKDSLLKSDYENLVRKIEIFNLCEEEIRYELQNCGVIV